MVRFTFAAARPTSLALTIALCGLSSACVAAPSQFAGFITPTEVALSPPIGSAATEYSLPAVSEPPPPWSLNQPVRPVAYDSPSLIDEPSAATPDAAAHYPDGPTLGDPTAGDSSYGSRLGSGYRNDNAPIDPFPTQVWNAFLGYDSWRGISDGAWGNNGIHAGLNYGSRLSEFSEWSGIGAQAGGWAGVYNWAGTDYHAARQTNATIQGFFTYGLFRRSTDESPWVGAVVNDWMFTDNYGVYAGSPTISQLRTKLGYAFSERSEYGFWGTVAGPSDSQDFAYADSNTWRAVQHLNFYWDYRWQYGAQTQVWFGVPEHRRLTGDGSLGDYIAGAAADVPLNERVNLYTVVSYMHQSASAGDPGAKEDAWAFVVGLSFHPRTLLEFGRESKRWAPLMPVANSAYFYVDSLNTY